MSSLFARWRQARLTRHQARAIRRRPIPDALWQATLANYPFLQTRSLDAQDSLRGLCSHFLDTKEFIGAHGFEVDDEVALAVAAQACLPVLHLGLAAYDAFVGIVMHADEVRVRRSWMDEDGLLHEAEESISGEAVEGGPVMLSWADVRGAKEVRADAADWAYNVVIHEFVHVLDLADGRADGVPRLPNLAARQRWLHVMQSAYDHFRACVVCGHATAIDPYGAESIDEFFAVASETFFVQPTALRHEYPDLYGLLDDYFQARLGAG